MFCRTKMEAGDRRIFGHFPEDRFRWMHEWGFNFARLPLDYRFFVEKDDWSRPVESQLQKLDEAIRYGRRYGIHVEINFHRAPGYCCNEPKEPKSLFLDPEPLVAFTNLWGVLARRYRGISNDDLSFDLVNEPAPIAYYGATPSNYAVVARAALAAIRAADPDRFVMSDGWRWGNEPVMELHPFGPATGESIHCYAPHAMTHHTVGNPNAKGPCPAWPPSGWTNGVEWLEKNYVKAWRPAIDDGTPLFVGEFGCFEAVPHETYLAWLEDMLTVCDRHGWGWALWNLDGKFGIMDTNRPDGKYEDFHGHRLERDALDVLRRHLSPSSSACMTAANCLFLENGRKHGNTAGWRAEGFPNQVFSESVLTRESPGDGKPVDVNYWFIDAQRSGRKFTRVGTSFALGATAAVEKSGRYRFRFRRHAKDGFAYELSANGQRLADFPEGVTLPKGTVSLAAFARLREKAHPTLGFALEWLPPGAKDWARVPAVVAEPPSVPPAFETALRLKDAKRVHQAWRTFTIRVDEAGLYDFAIPMPNSFCYLIRAFLDDLQIIAISSSGKSNAFCGDEDRTGDRCRQKLDFFGRYHARRWLAKGEHTLHYYVHVGPFFDGDEMDRVFADYPIGYTRLAGRERLRETAFYPEGRDSLVFAAGETLKVRAQTAWRGEPLVCTFKVRPEGGGEPVYAEKLSVDTAARHFTYACDREGVFEYTVEAEGIGVLDGPWALVVVDTKPMAAKRPRLEPVVVDAITGDEGAGGVHRFRDNGTSVVLTNADGVVYRKTGPAGFVKRAFATVTRPWKTSVLKLASPDENGRVYYGCDWYAYTLKVKHPGRTHLVRCTVPNDAPRLVTAVAVDWVTGHQAGWNMVTGDAPQAGKTGAFSFFVWPNTNALDVLVINSQGCHGLMEDRAGAVAKIELVEYPGGLPPLAPVGAAWNGSAEAGWSGEQVDIGVNERTMPPLWSDGHLKQPDSREGHDRRWRDFLCSWERFGEVSEYLGHNWHCFPSISYGMTLFQGVPRLLIPQGSDVYADAKGEVVDLFDRDVMALMVLMCTKHGLRYCADFMIQKCYEDLRDCWVRETGVPPEGMMLSRDATGTVYRTYSAATFPNPVHPVARRQIVRLYEAVAKRYGRYAGFGGIRTRFWEEWPGSMEGWFYDDTLGYDDWTVAQFAKERGVDMRPVGTDEKAFAERKRRLQTELADAWYAWRTEKCVSLREEVLAAVRKHAPQARLYTATPPDTHKRATGLDPAVVGDRRDLGFSRRTATTRDCYGVEWNHPDPIVFANFDVRPDPYCGDVAPTGTWHSLTGYLSGFCETGTSRIPPYNREAAALALSENALDSLNVGGQWSLPPTDEGLREFVRIWRSIPSRTDWQRLPVAGGAFAPFAVWQADGCCWLVNRTDRPRTAELTFRSGKTCAVRVPPYMPALLKEDGVVSFRTPIEADEIAEVKKRHREIKALEARAKTTAEADDYRALVRPMDAAAGKGDWYALRLLTLDFRTNHLRWFEICGWPADFCRVRHDIGYQCSGDGYRDMYKNFDEGKVERRREDYRKFLAFPQGKTMKYYKHGLGDGNWYEIQVTAILGGDYGDIRVMRNGTVLGVIPSTGGTPRLETRVLPVKVQSPGNGLAFELTGLGKAGLCILRCGARQVAPPRILIK